jgi:hypothetical protein
MNVGSWTKAVQFHFISDNNCFDFRYTVLSLQELSGEIVEDKFTSNIPFYRRSTHRFWNVAASSIKYKWYGLAISLTYLGGVRRPRGTFFTRPPTIRGAWRPLHVHFLI